VSCDWGCEMMHVCQVIEVVVAVLQSSAHRSRCSPLTANVLLYIAELCTSVKCVVWLRLWNDARVSGHWGRSSCSSVEHSSVPLSATHGQRAAVHCWAVHKCKTSPYSTAATGYAGRHWTHHRPLTSHQVRFYHFSWFYTLDLFL